MSTVYSEFAKVYKRLGPRVVAVLKPGDDLVALLGEYKTFQLRIAKSGIAWFRRAESLVAPDQRETVSIDDLALAFEATNEPLTEAQLQEDRESVRRKPSMPWVPHWEHNR